MKSALLSFSPTTCLSDWRMDSFFSFAAFSRGTWLERSLTKMKRRTTARMTKSEATGKARISFTGSSCPGSLMYTSIRRARATVPRMVAIPPIVLMTPLASLLRSPGTMSGMRATTGPRTACLERLKQKTSAIRSQREESAEKGIRPKSTAAIGSSVTMKGMRRPILVSTRSDRALKIGIRKIASTLSKVMMRPTIVLLSMKFLRKIGT